MDRTRSARLLIAVAVLALGGLLLRGYVTDDTFIHLRYARHLIERGELSFNPGEPTYGCSSPLWVFGLALLLKVGLSPWVAPWLLGAASALLVLLLFDALQVRVGVRKAWRLPLLLLVAADAWLVRWTWSGMETPLATAVLLLLVWPLFAGAKDRGGDGVAFAGGGGAGAHAVPLSPRLWFAWGAAAGLAALTRPEFLLLAFLAWPWLASRGERPVLLRAAAPAALGGALVYGPWLLYAWRIFGRFTPETAAAKSYGLTLDPAVLVGSLARSAQQLGATQAPLWLALLALVGLGLAARRRAGGAGAPAGWMTLRHVVPLERLLLAGLAVTWTAALVGGYAVKQVWVISRYLSPLSPVILLALAGLVDTLLPRRFPDGGEAPAERPPDPRGGTGLGRLRAALLLGGVLATLALNGWLLAARVRPHARELSQGIRECLLPMGEWLGRHTPEGAVVACLDIGVLGWASERKILDLAGLVSPELLRIGREQGFPAMVESGAWLDVVVPDYFVDRIDGPPRWADRTERGVTFRRLQSCMVPGLGVTEPQPWEVTLYQLVRR